MNTDLARMPALLLLTVAATTARADAPPARPDCTAAEHHQFDFWIGDWSVSDRGKQAGHNRIERVLGGCALLENWSGAGGGSGKSLNFYDRDDGKWHQTWIDASGGALFLSGGFADGAMVLEGERPASGKDPAVRHRITWTKLPDGKVRQLWESRAAGGGQWEVQFDGLYAPAAGPK